MRRLKFIGEGTSRRQSTPFRSSAFSRHHAARTTFAFSISSVRSRASTGSISSFLASVTKRRFCMGKVRGACTPRAFLVHGAPNRRAVAMQKIVQSNRRRDAKPFSARYARTKRMSNATLHAASRTRLRMAIRSAPTTYCGHRFRCRYARRPPRNCLQRRASAASA